MSEQLQQSNVKFNLDWNVHMNTMYLLSECVWWLHLFLSVKFNRDSMFFAIVSLLGKTVPSFVLSFIGASAEIKQEQLFVFVSRFYVPSLCSSWYENSIFGTWWKYFQIFLYWTTMGMQCCIIMWLSNHQEKGTQMPADFSYGRTKEDSIAMLFNKIPLV